MSHDVTSELREALADALDLELDSLGISGEVSCRASDYLADAVLALPAVRDALAAQEAVTAVRELHTRDSTEPYACEYCGQAWPCDVIHALDTAGDS